MSSDGSVSLEMIQYLRERFSQDPTNKLLQNALTNGHLIDVALDRDIVQSTDSSFSTKLDSWTATNQRSSGRCWLFAALNLFRPGAMDMMNMKDFEFSQAHILWPNNESTTALLVSAFNLKLAKFRNCVLMFDSLLVAVDRRALPAPSRRISSISCSR